MQSHYIIGSIGECDSNCRLLIRPQGPYVPTKHEWSHDNTHAYPPTSKNILMTRILIISQLWNRLANHHFYCRLLVVCMIILIM